MKEREKHVKALLFLTTHFIMNGVWLFNVPVGSLLEAVLSIGARFCHLFPVPENQCVQKLTLSSRTQENANKTKITSKFIILMNIPLLQI